MGVRMRDRVRIRRIDHHHWPRQPDHLVRVGHDQQLGRGQAGQPQHANQAKEDATRRDSSHGDTSRANGPKKFFSAYPRLPTLPQNRAMRTRLTENWQIHQVGQLGRQESSARPFPGIQNALQEAAGPPLATHMIASRASLADGPEGGVADEVFQAGGLLGVWTDEGPPRPLPQGPMATAGVLTIAPTGVLLAESSVRK